MLAEFVLAALLRKVSNLTYEASRRIERHAMSHYYQEIT